MRFLDSLGIPIIAVLRDTQNFIQSAEHGIGVHEMRPPSRVKADIEQVDKIVTWLDNWPARRRDNVEVAGISRRPLQNFSMLRKPNIGSI
jgi:hypothetical protein